MHVQTQSFHLQLRVISKAIENKLEDLLVYGLKLLDCSLVTKAKSPRVEYRAGYKFGVLTEFYVVHRNIIPNAETSKCSGKPLNDTRNALIPTWMYGMAQKKRQRTHESIFTT
jgi:hypothetical protein